LKTITQFILLTALFAIPHIVSAQNIERVERCGTSDYYKKIFQTTPSLKTRFDINQKRLSLSIVDPQALRITALDDTVTVVIHVIGSASMQSLVTNAVIQSQIDVLNEDYQGKNADSVRIPAAFKPRYGKSKLAFALARTNPFGEPTVGINRFTSNKTYTLATLDEAKFSVTGGIDAWDPTKYLNIWVVEFANASVLGSSVFPGDPRDLKYHGFVCDYRAFGRGAPHLLKQYTRGRTTTHEIGHFFNLQHIWGDDGGACSGTDFPNDAANDDTPNQANNTNGNPDPFGTAPVVTDNCSPVAPGVMYQNFMDYTDDSALVLFTKGQQVRMENTLNFAVDRAPLLLSTAYKPAVVLNNDAAIRQITNPTTTSCNSFKPSIILRNSGSSALTSVKINIVLNNATPIIFNWTGNLASYTETNVTLNTITAPGGNNTLTIYVSSPNGVTDQRTANDTAKRSFEVISVTPLPVVFEESFSQSQFPPQGWGINNPDGDMTWERIANIGKNAPGAAWFNDFNNATYHRFDDLFTPNFSYSNVDSITLSFNLASALYSDDPFIDLDTLTILVTKDCGNTFTTVYKKWGDSLQTLSPAAPVQAEFFPTTNQWRRDTVNLKKTLIATNGQFQVYFRFSGNFENNIFIDDVVISSKQRADNGDAKRYLLYPTVAQQQFTINHFEPEKISSISIFNSIGQRVWFQQYKANASDIINVNLQGFAAGVYFVRFTYTDGSIEDVEKIVKQ
jgi:hypothetical protein